MPETLQSLVGLVAKDQAPMFSLRYGEGNRLVIPYHTFTSAEFKPSEKTLVINAAGVVITLKCMRWGEAKASEPASLGQDETTVQEPGALLDYLEVMRIRSITVGGDIEVSIKAAFEDEMDKAENKADGFGGYEPPAEPNFESQRP